VAAGGVVSDGITVVHDIGNLGGISTAELAASAGVGDFFSPQVEQGIKDFIVFDIWHRALQIPGPAASVYPIFPGQRAQSATDRVQQEGCIAVSSLVYTRNRVNGEAQSAHAALNFFLQDFVC